jgi:anti-anti-sigma regulatory factor/GAF domain-containing protein
MTIRGDEAVVYAGRVVRQVVVPELENPSSESEVSSSLVAVGGLIFALTLATDARAVLGAALECLRRWQPDAAELVFVDSVRDGLPRDARVVAAWRDGHVLTDSSDVPPDGTPPSLWATASPEPVLAPTTATLPLYSEGHGGWLGALRLGWSAEHAYTAEERALLGLLANALSAHLGGRRTRQALEATLAERELLQSVIRELNQSTTLEQRLRVLLQPAPAADEAEVALCTFENDESGAPEWLNVVSLLAPAGRQAASQAGSRFHLPSIPFARLYLSSPDAPLMISDIQSDPRVDDYARSLYAMTGTRSTIVMGLTLQGRWVGLLNILWNRPIELGAREQRIFQALAAQAALLLDNSLMVDRLQSTLQASQHQGQLLQTVLDHIPAGVLLLAAPSARPILTNAAAHRLLGSQGDAAGDDPRVGSFTIVYPGTDRPKPLEELVGTRVAASGATETDEVDILTAEHTRSQIEVTAVPMLDAHKAVKNVVLVLSDVTARKRAEAERLQLQDEVIRVQAAALAERSSPIIPITDEILVLPIIGNIDLDRGQQVLATILEGTAQRRAKVAIIDITGVGVVDTQAATALIGAARALRLLGVEPILSGIRPDVAQTLVSLGVDLSGVATCGTLQSSIQHALRRLGRAGLAG